MKLSDKCFGAYDIRGIYPSEVNEELAYKIGLRDVFRREAGRGRA